VPRGARARNALPESHVTPERNDGRTVYRLAVKDVPVDGFGSVCIPTVDGWNYAVRLYRPKQAVLDKQWQFPAPRPVN